MLDQFLVARDAEAASQAVLFQSTIATQDALNALLDAARKSATDGDSSTAQPIQWN